LDNRPPPLKLNIDPQKDFNPAATDGLSRDKIKDYLKDIDFEKLMKNLPVKNKRHEETFINTIHLPPLDKSGSMGSILAHEIPHLVYKDKKILEKNSEPFLGTGKIIVFDEMTDAGKENFSDYFNDVTAMYDSYRASQACGQELAEGFQQGVAQPVAVRRPLSFRPRA